MKIGMTALMLGLLLLWSGVPAWGEEPAAAGQSSGDPSIAYQIGAKFARGATNFATGWIEVPKQIYLVGQHEGWLMGSFRGPIDGLGMFVARTVAGAYEVLTFPLPIPPQYQPMLKPEYVWQPEPTGSPPDSAGQSSNGPAR
jgi:putative exosortase-associated protein (TIGR04073 family)